MIKYASNALLATVISFSNEIANLGADDRRHRRGRRHAGRARVALPHRTPPADGTASRAPITSFLEAGCGFGGSCLPKDVTRADRRTGRRRRDADALLQAVVDVNDAAARAELVAPRQPAARRRLGGPQVTVLGLAFKPDTDDVRESARDSARSNGSWRRGRALRSTTRS